MTDRRTIIIATLLSVLATRASVGAADKDSPESAQDQRIMPLFDCFRMNSAWGFTLSGKVIDAGGNIFGYGRRGKAWLATPATEQGANYYPEAELQGKYIDARRTGGVDAAALANKSRLIEAAAAGKLSIADGGARDAGYSGCHAYMRDAARHRYRDIDLGSDGGVSDTRTTNDAPAARELLDWLRSVGVAQ